MDLGKIEYRVRPVTRYIVTRYHEGRHLPDAPAIAAGVETCGEFDNEMRAYEIGYALAKAEHERLGWPLDDSRISYPASPA